MKIRFSSFSFFLMLFFSIFCMAALCASAQELPTARTVWSYEVKNGSLEFRLRVPANYYAYAEQSAPELDPAPERAAQSPKAELHKDDFFPEGVRVYDGATNNGTYLWRYPLDSLKFPLRIGAGFQACRRASDTDESLCLMPNRINFGTFATLADLENARPLAPASTEDAGLRNASSGAYQMLHDYEILRSSAGYQPPAKFLKFLRGEEGSGILSFEGKSLLMTILIALLGGLALNLTPCVLPLIPVNLAIIGADTRTGNSKRERIVRGAVYGTGIALTYGVLGILAVLTGSSFGQLDATWYFNLFVSLIFIGLGLAMFDVFQLDFSSFSSKVKLPSSARYSGVFLIGAISAILAGACVAPVLVAALIQASGMYANGNYAGLFLPFLLGIGMALPWPFAAAGLSLFPKPGKWMMQVKHVLGVLIFALALYYGWIGGRLLVASIRPSASLSHDGGASAMNESRGTINAFADSETITRKLNEAISEAASSKKEVFIDFWATWCKNCTAMDLNTFSDPEVKKELEGFVVLKIQAEDLSNPAMKRLFADFSIKGLPSYVILRPIENGDSVPRP